MSNHTNFETMCESSETELLVVNPEEGIAMYGFIDEVTLARLVSRDLLDEFAEKLSRSVREGAVWLRERGLGRIRPVSEYVVKTEITSVNDLPKGALLTFVEKDKLL